MNVWRLVLREIAHRRLNFTLGLLSNVAAVACLVGAMTLLRAHVLYTNELLAAEQKKVEEAGKKLADDMRKITLGLGFNILILPKDQSLGELHTEGSLSSTMPEQYAEKLAGSKIVTINHLLPMVMKKVQWKEKDNRSVILIGTRGEVPLMHRDEKKPLQDPVAAGKMVVGYQIHRDLGLKQGGKVTLLGKEFEIAQLHPERGTVDDSTLWINLKEAQQLLSLENLIHAILALECNCAAKDRVGEIRNELAEILPGTQVIERGSQALARAEARNKAAQSARDSLAQHQAGRAQLLKQKEDLAAILVPIVLVASAVWIGILAYGNVRQRGSEIGILRAIGLRSRQIFSLILTKAFLTGLAGAVIGTLAGFAIGAYWGDPVSAASTRALFTPQAVGWALIVAPLLSVVASWIPAMLAAGQDPAVMLQTE